jgi:hypothetical protein
MTWGIESNVIERFVKAGIAKERIKCERDTFTFNYPASPSVFLGIFRDYYGPTMNAYAAAEKNGRAGELHRELEALLERENRHPNKNSTSIPATFMRVTVDV